MEVRVRKERPFMSLVLTDLEIHQAKPGFCGNPALRPRAVYYEVLLLYSMFNRSALANTNLFTCSKPLVFPSSLTSSFHPKATLLPFGS